MEEEAAQPMAEPQGPRGLASRPSPGEQPGQIAGPDFESEDEGEEFDDWEDDYDYPFSRSSLMLCNVNGSNCRRLRPTCTSPNRLLPVKENASIDI